MKRPTILFAWELGGGLGHMMRWRPIAGRLVESGCRVYLALRELPDAHRLFPSDQFQLLQAPRKTRPPADRFEPPSTFAHILYNMAFAGADELRGLVRAWRSLFETTGADLLVADHSPTALLAARGTGIKGAVIGSGFCCPPGGQPFPDWRPGRRNDPVQLQHDEQRVLECVNDVLDAFGAERLAHLADLYGDVDDTILATFAELDPFKRAADTEYCGVWSTGDGNTPVWPHGSGKRVFCYLKPFESLPVVLEMLSAMKLPTVLYCPGIHPNLVQRFAGSTLSFSDHPLDISLVAATCDAAILNATLNTTAAMLLAGKPLLLFPLQLEQRLTAERVQQMGAGQFLLANQIHDVGATLRDVLTAPTYTAVAQAVR